MLDLIGARALTSTVDELIQAHAELNRLLESERQDTSAPPFKIIKALADLVYVEAQLRDNELESYLRRMLDDRDAN